MPVKSMNSLKATSPSKGIQRGIDQAWGAQNKNSRNPQKVLGQKWTRDPIKVGKS